MRWVLDLMSEQDASGAGSEGWSTRDEVLKLRESFGAQELEERAGFTAWDDEAVQACELLGLADQRDSCSELLEADTMGVEIALQG